MENTLVRQRILDEHKRLREMLDALEALLVSRECAPAEKGRVLCEQGFALFEAFAAHLNLEDSMLVPAVENAGPEGKIRAEMLAREHRDQRLLLRFLMERLEAHPPTALLIRELSGLCAHLRDDMIYEEETVLREDLLG